jgi:geranylgeranyl transferase type-2 subunit alpha
MCLAIHLVHGWSYRRNVVANIREQQVDTKEIDTKEFEYTSTKIKQSFSNYSAWHYRSKVLPSILKDMTDEERTAVGKKGKEFGSTHAKRCVGCLLIIVQSLELDLIKNALYTEPDDQSAWLYYWWLVGRGMQKENSGLTKL